MDPTKITYDLEEAIIEAKELLSEVRSELKEARRVIKEMKHERETYIRQEVTERLEQAVEEGLKQYAAVVVKAMDEAVAKVNREFEKLFNTFMTGHKSGDGTDLRDLISQKQQGL